MISTLKTPVQAARWLQDKVSGDLSPDSRRIKRGDGFVAWPGYAFDARVFVQNALEQGANACLIEDEGVAPFSQNASWKESNVASYKGLKADFGRIADEYYGRPSEALKVLAVTGTNGKTSIAWWLGCALELLGAKCCVIGTLGVGELPNKHEQSVSQALSKFKSNGLTTPDPLTLQSSLRQFKEKGFEYCALEASSIGIAENRLSGTRIDTAIFSNLSRDHLDYHPSMDEYWSVKESLFEWPNLKNAVINLDDPKGLELYENLMLKKDSNLTLIGYGQHNKSNLQASEIAYPNEWGGLSFKVTYTDQLSLVQSGVLVTKFLGLYNLSNLLAVIGTMCAQGHSLKAVIDKCMQLRPVPGRMQRIESSSSAVPTVIVDYAHTPDALAKTLQSLIPLKEKIKGRLHCLIGCGGERDAGKRPQMAKFANEYADSIMLTSDNPRGESAQAIVDDMLSGLSSLPNPKVEVELDRALAIIKIIGRARSEDIVLIAGKGHENYQDINGIKLPFSDAEHAVAAMLSEQRKREVQP